MLGRPVADYVMGVNPRSIADRLFFIQQGALQNFLPYQAVNTLKEHNSCYPWGL